VDGRVDRMGFTAKLYTCGVCLEDSLSYRDMAMCFAGCGHRLCTTCAKAYIESKVRDGALHIQCQDMSAGRRCPSLIRTAVIWQVCGDATFAAYKKNLATNHAQRAAELMRDAKAGKDTELITWLHDNTRKCPLCSVIIYRHEGCDHMSCKCGHAFNWAVAPRIELPPAVQEERQRAAREEAAAAAAAVAAAEAKSQISLISSSSEAVAPNSHGSLRRSYSAPTLKGTGNVDARTEEPAVRGGGGAAPII
jgi:hypothetical protein